VVRARFTRVSMMTPRLGLRGSGEMYAALGGGWNAISLLRGIQSTIGAMLYEAQPLLP
jgi:hypothetical protein